MDARAARQEELAGIGLAALGHGIDVGAAARATARPWRAVARDVVDAAGVVGLRDARERELVLLTARRAQDGGWRVQELLGDTLPGAPDRRPREPGVVASTSLSGHGGDPPLAVVGGLAGGGAETLDLRTATGARSVPVFAGGWFVVLLVGGPQPFTLTDGGVVLLDYAPPPDDDQVPVLGDAGGELERRDAEPERVAERRRRGRRRPP